MLQSFRSKAMTSNCDCDKDLFVYSNQEAVRRKRNHFRLISMFVIRLLAIVRWFLPGAILVIIPKCPLCIAAYVLVGSGIGLSVTSATYLRGALIVVCCFLLLYSCSKWLWARYLR